MRLLNAEELKEALIEAGQNSGCEWGKNWKLTWEQILDVIDRAPTVDAVRVVRCVDCIHNNSCTWSEPDWYCADGERRSECD